MPSTQSKKKFLESWNEEADTFKLLKHTLPYAHFKDLDLTIQTLKNLIIIASNQLKED